MRYHKIPDETIQRLPIYLRGLLLSSNLLRQNISSNTLANILGTNPWQIRKDFSYFGDFGTPGVGCDTKKLVKRISKILKLDVVHRTALVGVGNLGLAILKFPGFKTFGFDIVSAFDTDLRKIGKTIKNIIIEDTVKLKLLKKRKIDLAILAIPRESAQKMADELVKVGVAGILNFSPCNLAVPMKVKVITIDIAMDLARLPYYMSAS